MPETLRHCSLRKQNREVESKIKCVSSLSDWEAGNTSDCQGKWSGNLNPPHLPRVYTNKSLDTRLALVHLQRWADMTFKKQGLIFREFLIKSGEALGKRSL
jgi:hypothetical protein